MTTLIKPYFSPILLSLLLVTGYAGMVSAQSAASVVPTETATTVEQATPVAAPIKIKTTSPTTAGKWVKRLSYKKCPYGSEAYVADDGGVKCWVNDN